MERCITPGWPYTRSSQQQNVTGSDEPPTMIDLNLFRVFDAIYLERNLTLAGRRLGVSQPAVSNALGRLRGHYDDPLFVRHGRQMRPTALAERIVPKVRQALVMLGETLEPGR